MRKICLIVAAVCVALTFGSGIGLSAGTAPPQKQSCKACHSDLKEVLPSGHKPVAGDGIKACVSCHKPGKGDGTKPSPLFTRLHKPHASSVDCEVCHAWSPGKAFTVIGSKQALGTFSQNEMKAIKKEMTSWAESGFLDALHGRKDLTCRACHDGNLIPDDSETRENKACIKCHGSLDKLASGTREHINPHKSHLGEIACTACHHGHIASKPYCSNCHTFNMKIPGAGTEIKPAAKPAAVAPETTVPRNIRFVKTDIVVIGSGAAGMVAAITAHDMGAKVIVLEKQPVTGGNSMLAAGGMNAAGTKFQQEKGIKDSPDLMYKDTTTGGKNLNDPALVRILADKSASSVEWLTKLGADLSDVGRLGGASVDRAHRPRGGTAVGAHIVNTLRKNAALRHIDIRTNSRVVRILEDKNGRVTGVLVDGAHSGLYGISARAVVNAAGGFSANPAKVAMYQPSYAGMTTSNQPGATGEGMDLGAQAGGELKDMKEIQIHPSVAVGSRILITEAVRGNGAIMVNREGKRFVNEITTRDAASAAVLAQTGKTAFLIFDEGIRKSLKQIDGYFELGLVKEGATPEDLAAKIKVPPEALKTTIEQYNKFYAAKVDADFKRPNMPRPIETPKFYAIEIAPGIHYTMGGLKINTEAEVMSKEGKPIPGFFAAGEVTGGVHGANRLGGNSISETITFGRIAGENAARLVKKPSTPDKHKKLSDSKH